MWAPAMTRLEKRDNLEPRGAVLRSPPAPEGLRVRRHRPSAALAPFVTHYWFIDWDLSEPHVQRVLPRPAVNLVSEADRWHASGVWTRRFDRELRGAGAVFGVLFQPAGFSAFAPGPLHRMTDDVLDMAPRTGVDPAALHRALVHDATDEARVVRLDALLTGLKPRVYDGMDTLNATIRWAEEHATRASAEDLAGQAGMTLRTLQRHMREHVGVGPKALLRRFRLHEAAARLAEGEVDQAALAFALGYFDQAHFVRDFSRTIGQSPSAYAAAARPSAKGARQTP